MKFSPGVGSSTEIARARGDRKTTAVRGCCSAFRKPRTEACSLRGTFPRADELTRGGRDQRGANDDSTEDDLGLAAA